jgi:mono/diheme cytochrome c family protein
MSGVIKSTLLAVAGLAAVLLSGCSASDSVASKPASADQIKRGQYLAQAADCMVCHTAKDGSGATFAGGYPIHSPFGVIYGTNITPDKEHGIGAWSADDFFTAVTEGITPKHRLFPAMPYASYKSMTREDSDAIYAYLMTKKPVALANKENGLSFPFSFRPGLFFWQSAFLKDQLPDVSSGASAEWQRGRYVTNVLGHCAECHTPRTMAGNLDLSKSYQGNPKLDRIGAPDITPSGLAARGWTTTDLATFFAKGVAPQGSAYGEMYPVVHFSTQHMSGKDISAIATYLMGDTPPAPQPLKTISADAALLKAGQRTYIAVCAGCHGLEGQGKPNVSVAMKGNSTLRDINPQNLIVSTLDGIAEQKFPNNVTMQEMPGFARTLSDLEMSQLVNFLRATWGGQAADVSAEQIKAFRSEKH